MVLAAFGTTDAVVIADRLIEFMASNAAAILGPVLVVLELGLVGLGLPPT